MYINCGYIQKSFQNDLNSNSGWSITRIDNTVHASEILLNSRAIGSWISQYLHICGERDISNHLFFCLPLATPYKRRIHTTHTTSVTIIPIGYQQPEISSHPTNLFISPRYVWRGKYPADPQWEDTQVTNGDGMGHLHDGIVDQIFSDDRSNKETHVYPVVRDENNFNFGGYFNLDTMIIYYWNLFGKPTKNTKINTSVESVLFSGPQEREFGSTSVFTLKLNTLSALTAVSWKIVVGRLLSF